jgi:hypothetical protein
MTIFIKEGIYWTLTISTIISLISGIICFIFKPKIKSSFQLFLNVFSKIFIGGLSGFFFGLLIGYLNIAINQLKDPYFGRTGDLFPLSDWGGILLAVWSYGFWIIGIISGTVLGIDSGIKIINKRQ